jgi:hypothetical protein
MIASRRGKELEAAVFGGWDIALTAYTGLKTHVCQHKELENEHSRPAVVSMCL